MAPKVVYCAGVSVILGITNAAIALILGGGPLLAYVAASLTASVAFPLVALFEARKE